jgi:hypothetical protein
MHTTRVREGGKGVAAAVGGVVAVAVAAAVVGVSAMGVFVGEKLVAVEVRCSVGVEVSLWQAVRMSKKGMRRKKARLGDMGVLNVLCRWEGKGDRKSCVG